MHTFTPEQASQFSRKVGEVLGVSARCVRKARQGSIAAMALIKEKAGAANIGRSIAMDEMAKAPSLKATGKKKLYNMSESKFSSRV